MPMEKSAVRFQEPLELTLRGAFSPKTVDAEARTAELVWSTGARVLRRGVWTEDYYEDLDMTPEAIRMDRLNQGAPLLNSHRGETLDSVLGVVERAWVKDGKGHALVRFSERAEVEPVFQDVKAGILRNVSVGYSVWKYERQENADGIDVLRAVDWEPHELSLVSIPADSAAQVRGKEFPLKESEDAMATKRGKAADAAEVKAEVRAEADAPETTTLDMPAKSETRAKDEDCGCGPSERELAQEQAPSASARVSAIFTSVRKANLGVDVAQELIESDLSVEEARAKIIELMAKSEATVRSHIDVVRDEQDTTRSAVAEAILHRADPASNKLTELGRRYRSRTLLEIARELLEQRGINTAGMTKMELAGRALQSTSDFTLITADVLGKTLRDQYAAAPRTFQVWARQTTAPDFKAIKRIQLGDAPSLTKVNEAGEFSYGTIGEQQEEYVLMTYGKILPFTRQLLINDDLGAFNRVASQMARRVADLESTLVYGVLTDNAAMADGTALFHADHSNLGTAGAISSTTLDEGRQNMRLQTGLAGNPLDIAPRFLVVGPKNETAAMQFVSQEYLPNTPGNINVFAGSLQVVVENRLTGTDWYLMADPAAIDTVEYAYLEGQEAPFVETQEGFDVDGVKFKIRHDFAAKAIDHRGMFKNAGA